MASVHLDIPESALAAVHCGPQEFSAEMRLIAAMAWYGQGRISQEVAAEIAGLSGDEFVTALARMERSSLGADSEEILRDILGYDEAEIKRLADDGVI